MGTMGLIGAMKRALAGIALASALAACVHRGPNLQSPTRRTGDVVLYSAVGVLLVASFVILLVSLPAPPKE